MIVFDIKDTKNNRWTGKAIEVGVFRYERRTVTDGDFKGMVYYLVNRGFIHASKLPYDVKIALDSAISKEQKYMEWR